MSYTGSASDRLAAVQTSIGKCLNSQEYWVGGRKQRMAELKQLRALEVELLAEVAAGSGSGSMCEMAVQVGGDR